MQQLAVRPMITTMVVIVGTIIVFCRIRFTFAEPFCKLETKCKIDRVYGMISADCYKREIRSIPQCISSGIEVLDLSYNRIRKINRNDLKRYRYLKMLYLTDNAIVSIHKEAFSHCPDLTVLDLSMNAFTTVPSAVFQLPKLKTLYLGQNLNFQLLHTFSTIDAISSPITYLDLNEIYQDVAGELVSFLLLPFLNKYNISRNHLSTVTPAQFAGLCGLQDLDTSNVSLADSSSCDCMRTNAWLRQRSVQFHLFPCTIPRNGCSYDIGEEELEHFHKCMELYRMAQAGALDINTIIIITIAAVIIILITILIFIMQKYCHRKYQKVAK